MAKLANKGLVVGGVGCHRLPTFWNCGCRCNLTQTCRESIRTVGMEWMSDTHRATSQVGRATEWSMGGAFI